MEVPVLMFRTHFILIMLLLSGVQLKAQDVSRPAREAVSTIRELRAIPLPVDVGESGPPARVPNLLRQLNRELRELIVGVLNDPRRRSLATEDNIYTELKHAGWDEIPSHKWNAFGEITKITFDWITDHDPTLLVASTQLWDPCGSTDPDSTLYILQKNARNWDLILIVDTDFDPAGSSTSSAMQYALSSSDENGHWYLSVANSPPNCREAPKEVRFRVLRPGATPDKPIVLMDLRESFTENFQPPFEIRAEEDRASITHGKVRTLDGELGIAISRFDMKGDRMSRVPPLALTPEDFLDEWVRLDWNEAAQWSNNSGGANLQDWHSKLKGFVDDSTEIEFVQPCPERVRTENSWLIGLWIDRQQNPTALDERLYIEVSEREGAFYLDSIQKTRTPSCPGTARPTILTEPNLPDW